MHTGPPQHDGAEPPPSGERLEASATVQDPVHAPVATEAPVAPGRVARRRQERKERRAKRAKGPLGFLKELPVLLLVAFVLALLIKTFLVQAFYIPSASMENSLLAGDRVLVNKLVYRFHPPRRGDIIVFEEPHPVTEPDRGPFSAFVHWLTEGLGVSSDPEKDFIKRVIALPGETVMSACEK